MQKVRGCSLALRWLPDTERRQDRAEVAGPAMLP